jgi:HSP20 family molecular chaperone IbpA
MTMARRRRRSVFDLLSDYVDEFDELSEELNEAITAEHPSWDLESCCVQPLCNVSVARDEVVVTADLPNTDPETIKIKQVNRQTLEISAKMKRKIHFKELGITHRQGEFQFFRCQTRIPVLFDLKGMKTRFRRGILEVRLPRRIGVKVHVK